MILSSNYPTIVDFDPFSGSTQQQSQLGVDIALGDRRTFSYALAGANLTAGNLGVEPTSKANHMGINPSAAAASGSTLVSVTLGATAATVGEYNEGWLAVSGTPGNGQVYKVSSNPAIASSGTGTIALMDPINVALTTSSIVNLIHNPSNGSIEGTVQTKKAVGVPLTAVASGSYYWAQKRGYAAVLADAATGATLGSAMVASGTVSGAITASAATFSPLIPVVAINTLGTGVASKNYPVLLTIN